MGQVMKAAPSTSTTRFVLLMLVACAATTFATYWWLVAERGDWIGQQRACVRKLRHASPPGVLVSTYNGCMGGIALRQEGLVLLGAAAILVVTVIVTAGSVPAWLAYWGSGPEQWRLTEVFERALTDLGVRRRPRLVMARRGSRGQARVFGIYPRYWVLADPLLVAAPGPALSALFRHEAAHLRAWDVDRARLARTIWGLFIAILAPALVISIARQGGVAWAQIGLRLLILFAAIHLIFLSLLRTREHEADVLADAAEPGLAAILASQRQPRRRLRSWPEFLRAHPSPARRAAVLENPRLLSKLSLPDFAVTGLAAGAIFQELAIAVGAVLPNNQTAAYCIAGLIIAIPIGLICVTGLLQDEAVRNGTSGLVVAAAGALLGVGLLIGSQLSPRAATNWEQTQLIVSPVLPGSLSLPAVGLGGAAALALVIVIGVTLFALWARSFARALNAAFASRSDRWRLWVAVSVAAVVLSVPLGTWFVVCRLAGDSVDGPQGEFIAALLHDPTLLLWTIVTTTVGLVALVSVVAMAGPAATLWWRTMPVRVLTWAAVASLVPAMAWFGGVAVQRAVASGAAAAAAGQGGANAALPDLPPAVTLGSGPISPGVGCLVLTDQEHAEQFGPLDLEQLGSVLQRTSDQALDTMGAILVQAGTAPIDTIREVWRAAAFRCFILNSS